MSDATPFYVTVGTRLQRNERLPTVQYLDSTWNGPDPEWFPPLSRMVVVKVHPPVDYPYPSPDNGYFVTVRFDDGREETIWYELISATWFIAD